MVMPDRSRGVAGMTRHLWLLLLVMLAVLVAPRHADALTPPQTGATAPNDAAVVIGIERQRL